MEFGFDPHTSTTNLAKHGIDFEAAQALWRDDRLLEVQARTMVEPRWLVVGRVAGVAWSAVITSRDRRMRLMSVRRARAEEVALYEGEGL